MNIYKNLYSLCCYDKESGEINREIKCVATVKITKTMLKELKKHLLRNYLMINLSIERP